MTRRKTDIGEKVTERTIFRKSGLEKSTKTLSSVFGYRERRPCCIYRDETNFIKTPHAHHHHRHVVENTTTNNNDDEKETKNARRVPTLHADEPAVGSVPHRAIPFHRIFLSRRENDREPICRRAGHERVRQERRNDRE